MDVFIPNQDVLINSIPLREARDSSAIMTPDTQASIVLLQVGKAGPILGAAWTGLWWALSSVNLSRPTALRICLVLC